MRRIFRFIRRIWHIERSDARVAIRVRQPLVFGAFIVALAWYLAAPTQTTVMAAVALGGMILFGFLWVRALGSHLAAARRLRYAALQVGEELEEEISLANGAFVPALWAEFEDHSNIPGYTLSSVRGVDARGEARWRATTLCARRGVFALGPWDLLSGDPFGIFGLRLSYPSREEILVYPPLAPLPSDLLPRGRAVGEQRLLRQALPAETINLFSTRPYAPGDPLHHVHWRTTARRGDLFVKVFEPESYSAVWLIPNLDAAHQWGQGDESSLEKMIVLAASLASELLGARRAVGLFTPIPKGLGEILVPAQAGAGHLWQILRGLAGLPTLEGLQAAPRLPFEDTLQRAARVVSRRSLLIALSPSAAGGGLAWVDGLAALQRRAGAARGARAEAGCAAVLLLPGQEADAACLEALAGRGIPARAVRAQDIRPQTASYGALQRWEFTTLGTGRAYARRKPREAASRLPGGEL